jgi:hypothetical protein
MVTPTSEEIERAAATARECYEECVGDVGESWEAAVTPLVEQRAAWKALAKASLNETDGIVFGRTAAARAAAFENVKVAKQALRNLGVDPDA